MQSARSGFGSLCRWSQSSGTVVLVAVVWYALGHDSQSDGNTWCSCKTFVEEEEVVVVVVVVVARAFLLDEMLRCASDRKD